jgi:Xaa-Pro aminopeptidase
MTRCRFGGLPSLGFERLTLVPISTKLVETAIMSAEEVSWLDQYHQQVRVEMYWRLPS